VLMFSHARPPIILNSALASRPAGKTNHYVEFPDKCGMIERRCLRATAISWGRNCPPPPPHINHWARTSGAEDVGQHGKVLEAHAVQCLCPDPPLHVRVDRLEERPFRISVPKWLGGLVIRGPTAPRTLGSYFVYVKKLRQTCNNVGPYPTL
jgi:hypothetical protein